MPNTGLASHITGAEKTEQARLLCLLSREWNKLFLGEGEWLHHIPWLLTAPLRLIDLGPLQNHSFMMLCVQDTVLRIWDTELNRSVSAIRGGE